MRETGFVAKCWIDWFCGDEGSTRFFMPIRMPDGKSVMATDGIMAIVADVPESQAAEPQPKRYTEAANDVARWLADAAGKSVAGADAAALRQFADQDKPGTTVSECSECHGKGRTIHVCACELCDASDEECSDCDGSGKVTEGDDDHRWGVIFDHGFDRRLIGYLLEHAPATPHVTLELVAEKLRVIAPSWSAIIMSGKRENIVPETPRFNV